MTWRLARSIVVLRNEINLVWPNRDKASDGTIGDLRHQLESTSDHNPFVIDNGVGVVRAIDIDSGPGLNPDDAHDTVGDMVAEAVRLDGLHGHPALKDGGYVISERRIASAKSGWLWRAYTGSDPHESHVHISVGLSKQAYDSTVSWHVTAGSPVNPYNADSGPWGAFPIPMTHAFGPRNSHSTPSWHDGSCHLICARAIGAIRREVGAPSGNRWTSDLTAKVLEWQRYVRTHGTPSVPLDGVVRKITWDTMVRR